MQKQQPNNIPPEIGTDYVPNSALPQDLAYRIAFCHITRGLAPLYKQLTPENATAPTGRRGNQF
jgi:hypothetical protein